MARVSAANFCCGTLTYHDIKIALPLTYHESLLACLCGNLTQPPALFVLLGAATRKQWGGGGVFSVLYQK